MKISVIGAGALGTFYAAMLAASGQDVTLVCRPKYREALEKGVQVDGVFQATAKPRISDRPVPADLVFTAVKSYDVEAAVEGLSFNPGTLVVVISNGLGSDEAAAAKIGSCRVAAGVSYSGVVFLEPGRVHVAGYTETVLGSTDPGARDRLDMALIALEKAGLKARIADDIRAAQWEKLFANVGINAITAITGLKNGMLLEIPELKALVTAAVSEAGEVARAAGIRVGVDPVEQTYRVIRDTAGNRSSMLQDVTKGKRTEIDVLNSKIAEIGRACGIPTPVNDTITALIRGIEHRHQ
ncbi:ketopantoate reductase family protein [Methanocella arvoryzae]|uniref:2-dehydropantoate 2-reductase n=1 Tax=Methanocella arvoryzae (strain DSM 22066 / NBRC 105507 / MRE50) TaxID=351160 RepID=Q0W2G7_METAR|nr:ketopantoate reductase family protein [Methanocella arvoryzae]CAJ37426.1 putative 2-dehydropantoate 2-reductase [Methanocella arvoryzae MRE50]